MCGELLVSISGAYGVIEFGVPWACAGELKLPLGSYELSVRGRSNTNVLGASRPTIRPCERPPMAVRGAV